MRSVQVLAYEATTAPRCQSQARCTFARQGRTAMSRVSVRQRVRGSALQVSGAAAAQYLRPAYSVPVAISGTRPALRQLRAQVSAPRGTIVPPGAHRAKKHHAHQAAYTVPLRLLRQFSYPRGTIHTLLVEHLQQMPFPASLGRIASVVRSRRAPLGDLAASLESRRQIAVHRASKVTTVRRAARLEMQYHVETAQSTARKAPYFRDLCALGTTPLVAPILVSRGPPKSFVERVRFACTAFKHTARSGRLVRVRAWRPPRAPGAAAMAMSAQ